MGQYIWLRSTGLATNLFGTDEKKKTSPLCPGTNPVHSSSLTSAKFIEAFWLPSLGRAESRRARRKTKTVLDRIWTNKSSVIAKPSEALIVPRGGVLGGFTLSVNISETRRRALRMLDRRTSSLWSVSPLHINL